jgi:hypothetical protein
MTRLNLPNLVLEIEFESICSYQSDRCDLPVKQICPVVGHGRSILVVNICPLIFLLNLAH